MLLSGKSKQSKRNRGGSKHTVTHCAGLWGVLSWLCHLEDRRQPSCLHAYRPFQIYCLNKKGKFQKSDLHCSRFVLRGQTKNALEKASTFLFWLKMVKWKNKHWKLLFFRSKDDERWTLQANTEFGTLIILRKIIVLSEWAAGWNMTTGSIFSPYWSYIDYSSYFIINLHKKKTSKRNNLIRVGLYKCASYHSLSSNKSHSTWLESLNLLWHVLQMCLFMIMSTYTVKEMASFSNIVNDSLYSNQCLL